MEHDSLRQVRNSFYLGLYAQSSVDAQELMKSSTETEQVKQFAEIYYYRSLVFIDPATVIRNISSTASTGLQVIKELALYHSSTSTQQQQQRILQTLIEWKNNELTANDITLTIILAYLYINNQQYKEALQLVLNDAEHMEKLTLSIMIYLYLDRSDLANKTLKVLMDLDDDDVLTQLASCWLLLSATSNSTAIDAATASSKTLEAESILQGLSENFPSSTSLLTSLAVAELHKHNYTDAFKLLKQAREIGLDNSGIGDATHSQNIMVNEVLFNSIVSVQQMNRIGTEETIAAIKAELSKKPENQVEHWKLAQQKREEDFNSHIGNYKWRE